MAWERVEPGSYDHRFRTNHAFTFSDTQLAR